jgi:hypothetical protein
VAADEAALSSLLLQWLRRSGAIVAHWLLQLTLKFELDAAKFLLQTMNEMRLLFPDVAAAAVLLLLEGGRCCLSLKGYFAGTDVELPLLLLRVACR